MLTNLMRARVVEWPLRHLSTIPSGLFTESCKIAVVGSGPAGMYTAETLSKELPNCQIDVIEKLPVPFGLVKFGVAPDHPEVKVVSEKFGDLLKSHPRIRFVPNVALGKANPSLNPHEHVSQPNLSRMPVSELHHYYDAAVICCGADGERELGVAGEQTLEGVYSARQFVGWYNSHPHFQWPILTQVHSTHIPQPLPSSPFSLTPETRSAAIIGNGNVALDVARILMVGSSALCEKLLSGTDISTESLKWMQQATHLDHVHLIGRRGPAQSAFTNKELREILDLQEVCDVFICEDDLQLNESSKEEAEKTRAIKRMISLLEGKAKKISRDQLADATSRFPSQRTDGKKNLFLHYFQSPKELKGHNGKLETVVLERTRLEGAANEQKAVLTGSLSELHCDILFKSIGYKTLPIDGVPYDARRGVIPNEKGRVVRASETEGSFPLYVAGWCKRGPSGIIGTNLFDAQETVRSLIEDLREKRVSLSPRQTFVDNTTLSSG